MKSVSASLLGIFLSAGLFAQSLGSIESVEYDHANHRFLVSNGNTVVVVDSNGDPVEYFGNDPEADYGMEVMGSALYAIVGGSVKAFDLTSGLEISSITITGAQFLNGMASDGNYRIWVTDFNAYKVYEIDYTDLANPSYVEVVSNTVAKPNGICFDAAGNRLVFVEWATSASINAISLTDYSLSELVANTGVAYIDGIDNDDNGNYFIASWNPNRITKYSSDFSVNEIITVAGGLSSPADIAYAEEIDTLIIPNSGNATVRFVGFAQSNQIQTNEADPFQFACYPNPVNENTVLYFTLAEPGPVRIEILDEQGRFVELAYEENMAAARHRLFVGDPELMTGKYFWKISQKSGTSVIPFICQSH